jgi:HPt (histidine-containing phosphotransfer) domain-containing protein
MDISTMMESFGLDLTEWKEILDLFIEKTVSDLDELGKAIQEADPSMAVKPAHSIKGASANLGLDGIFNAAKGIEEKAREGSLEGAQASVTFIRQSVVTLQSDSKIDGGVK